MRVNKTGIALAISAIAILTGCSSTDEKPLDISHGGSEVVDASTDAYQQKDLKGVSSANESSENSDKGENSPLKKEKNNQTSTNNIDNISSTQTIYFLYDSSEVEPSFIPLIEKQSQDLVDNSEHTLILEGHADERGSREYNIALGEERAKAVAKLMQARGVRAKQLEIVSYGEEKPASVEHSETAWHLNRRVNLISQRTQK